MGESIKKIVIILATTVFSLAIHSMVPMSESVPLTPENLSVVANKLTFVGTATLFFLVTYYIIAVVFLKYQERLPGNKLTRSLLFGVLVGGIWWVGMIEAVFAMGTSFREEFFMGLADFAPIVVLPILLSLFVVRDEGPVKTQKIELKTATIDIGIFLVVFVVGRYLRYVSSVGGYEAVNMLPLILWTASFAVIIALNYTYLVNVCISSTLVKTAARFTLILFGLHYGLFVYFIPLIFKGMFVDLTIIFIYDLLLVFLASLICGHVSKKVDLRLEANT